MKSLKVVPYLIHVYLVKGVQGKSQDPWIKANLPVYDESYPSFQMHNNLGRRPSPCTRDVSGLKCPYTIRGPSPKRLFHVLKYSITTFINALAT
jgi:hypothetical protein